MEPRIGPITAALLSFALMMGGIVVMSYVDQLGIVAEVANGE